MGKKSGITKGGRTMNPADRERKQLRAKELKRNKKQRTAVRHAIVKGRDPDEIIEAMSRLDEQEFDPQRQLSLNVIQEKRSKLRGSFYQIVGLYRQEKEEKKVKNLERMLLEYETERARKEENFRAQMFSQNADFEDIPLPMGTGVPGSASTPSFSSINIGGQIGPQIPPQQLQSTMKASILKKPTSSSTIKKKHKYPPGPPPGLPPHLFDSDQDEEEDEGRDERRERSKRVRFGEEPTKRGGGEEERGEYDYEGEEDEDYAPVEIPEELLDPGNQSHQQQGMGIYSSQQQVPSLAAPIIGSGPIMPTMAPPPPAYPPAGYPIPGGRPMQMPHSERMARGGQMAAAHSSHKNGQSSYPPPDDPHPSAIISAEPQVVKPNVILPTAGQTVISSGPQMRNIARESTRFVPAAVKLGRSIVQQPAIGPKIPTSSSSVAGTSTKLVPRSATTAKQQKARMEGNGGKSMDQACDEFLKELEGLF